MRQNFEYNKVTDFVSANGHRVFPFSVEKEYFWSGILLDDVYRLEQDKNICSRVTMQGGIHGYVRHYSRDCPPGIKLPNKRLSQSHDKLPNSWRLRRTDDEYLWLEDIQIRKHHLK